MDAEEKSLDFAHEVTKQFLSLATAVPALMITFAKDFVSPLGANVKVYAFWSWGCFLLSVLFGLLTLMAMTGLLAERAKLGPDAMPAAGHGLAMRSNLRWFAGIQIVVFFVGMVFVVIFGWKAA